MRFACCSRSKSLCREEGGLDCIGVSWPHRVHLVILKAYRERDHWDRGLRLFTLLIYSPVPVAFANSPSLSSIGIKKSIPCAQLQVLTPL
ncbi:hypothetical protein GQ53DRAFT_543477 [Thozetella sp. PMI_491]|nr:hypothetical protein GQ53DRAFT_543477 [Thozetella sp. PMI_491]